MRAEGDPFSPEGKSARCSCGKASCYLCYIKEITAWFRQTGAAEGDRGEMP